jgi:signal transduction histidine kinase
MELPAELGRLAPEVETALFRIVQEGLANVHRHSGSSKAAIRISMVQGGIRLDVEDEGSGTPAAAFNLDFPGDFGVGIPSMRERAQQLGGRMEINSGDSGTTITVNLPIERKV